MRPFLIPVLFVLSCGGRVAEEASEDPPAIAGGAAGEGGGGPAVAPGCPPRLPAENDACFKVSYYCDYYASPTSVCATAWKCSDGAKPAPGFIGGFQQCHETQRAELCDSGLSCNSVEPDGGCIVLCEHSCRCNRETQLLEYEALSC